MTDNAAQTKGRRETIFLNVGIWLLFFALLIPAVAVGYAIGHGT